MLTFFKNAVKPLVLSPKEKNIKVVSEVHQRETGCNCKNSTYICEELLVEFKWMHEQKWKMAFII